MIGRQPSKCVKEWWKSCLFLAAFAVLAIIFNVFVPLFFVPVALWIFGLFVLSDFSIQKAGKKSNETPSEKALLLESKNKSCEIVDWSRPTIIKLLLKRLPTNFEKPFDQRVANALMRATADSAHYFEASTGYNHCQRIYLVFSRRTRSPFRLRLCRLKAELVSVVVSFLAVRFSYHLKQQNFDDNPTLKNAVLEMTINPPYFFIANSFNSESDCDLLNYMIDATGRITVEIGLHRIASLHFIPAEIQNKSLRKISEMLAKKRNIFWQDQPEYLRCGFFIKRSVTDEEGRPTDFSGEENSFEFKTHIPVKMNVNSKKLEFSKESLEFLFSEPVLDFDSNKMVQTAQSLIDLEKDEIVEKENVEIKKSSEEKKTE